ncbi:MAG: PilZ domain-containing protein [bacterium]|nr:PilZ domain-containing protein [bacterium]
MSRPISDIEVIPGPPRVAPDDHLQAAVHRRGKGWQKHPVVVVARARNSLELEAVLREQPPELHPGAHLRCTCRVNEAFLYWSSTAVEVLAVTPVRFVASLPPQHYRIQRRRFARVQLSLPVTFEVLGPDEATTAGQGVTADLGGGGISLTTTTELLPGQMVRMTVLLGPDRSVEVEEARVVRIARPAGDSAGVSCYGLHFTKLPGVIGDLIYQRIFEEQARLRRLGLDPGGG